MYTQDTEVVMLLLLAVYSEPINTVLRVTHTTVQTVTLYCFQVLQSLLVFTV